jgi:uncharacterized membrane protein YbhN (UPF0104 family)
VSDTREFPASAVSAGTGRPSPQLYASARSDPRARRPVDALRAVLFLLLLIGATLLSVLGADLDRGISEVLQSFPGFLQVAWLVGFWGALAWSGALLVIALVDRRPLLAVEGVAAACLALGIAVAVAVVVTEEADDVVRRLVDVDGPPVFPPAALAMTAAVIASMAPFLTMPWRRFGRGLVLAQLIGSLFLGAAQSLGAVTALAVGLLAGTIVHLIAGSPGGLPTVSRVRSALEGLGVATSTLEPASIRRDGVVVLAGTDATGPIEVKVYGRDAWEGELLAGIWRLVWYRGADRTVRLRRAQYIEHEGFMLFLADSAGVRVPHVVTAGRADNGDALIVVRPDGAPLTADTPPLSPAHVEALWSDLLALHRAGVVHHRIDLDRLAVRDDGTIGFADLSSAAVRSSIDDEIVDHAQLVALTTLLAGAERSADGLRSALGDERSAAVLPYIQEAAVPPMVRSELRRRHVELDDVRARLAGLIDSDEPELVKVRRVTWRSILSVALFGIAALTIIGMIADLDLEAFWRDLSGADWWWIVAALIIGQTPRIANAVSTMGSTDQPLPIGPTTGLHFATCYVNLAVPSSAGKVAITTRFFQRFGVPPASALSSGLIDSLSEFVTQIALFVLVLMIADVDLGLSLDASQLSGIATTALIVLVVLLVVAAASLAVPSLRARVLGWLHQGRQALAVLRSPRKLAQLFGGNVVSQVLFAVTLGAAVRAFGFDVPLSSLILINTIVSLFAGLLPVPGGVGVSEAGISLGLTRAGVPAESALAIALTYRFCTFYLPPVWGYAAYRWMTKHRYL